MSLPLQQQRYIEDKTIKRMVTLVKAAEKAKESSFAAWWSLWGIHNKQLPKSLVEAVNGHLYWIIQFGPSTTFFYQKKVREHLKKEVERVKKIKPSTADEAERTLYLDNIIYYIGNPAYQKTLSFLLRQYAQSEPDMAQLCAELISEVQLMLYNVGLFQVPPGIIDFEEPEEGDIYIGGGEDVKLTPPEPEGTSDGVSGETE